MITWFLRPTCSNFRKSDEFLFPILKVKPVNLCKTLRISQRGNFIKSRKTKGGNKFRFIPSVQLIFDIYCRSVILYDPKGIGSCKKSIFIIKIFDLFMKSWNADVIVLARVLIDDLGEITVNLALIGVLCNCGGQYIFDKQWLSMTRLSITNLDLRSLMNILSYLPWYYFHYLVLIVPLLLSLTVSKQVLCHL